MSFYRSTAFIALVYLNRLFVARTKASVLKFCTLFSFVQFNIVFVSPFYLLSLSSPWGAADAEIKVSSGANTELKRSPFQVWSRPLYSHTCYAYCQGFLPCLFLPLRSIHLHFFQKPLPISPVLAATNVWFLCRPAE